MIWEKSQFENIIPFVYFDKIALMVKDLAFRDIANILIV